MKNDYLITNGQKYLFFQLLSKAKVPGIQDKTNNIKIDSENKSIFVIYIKKEQNMTLFFQ